MPLYQDIVHTDIAGNVSDCAFYPVGRRGVVPSATIPNTAVATAVIYALSRLPQRIGQAYASPASSPARCVTKRAFEVPWGHFCCIIRYPPLNDLPPKN
jgi:hypothetical protein